jgi:hypothetical protein
MRQNDLFAGFPTHLKITDNHILKATKYKTQAVPMLRPA